MMETAFAQQYALVASARSVLLNYCAGLAPAHFTTPVAEMNNSSIRDLLVHVAGCYHYWLGEVGLNRRMDRLPPETVPDAAALRAVFAEVDALVAEFSRHHAAAWLAPQRFILPRQAEPLELTPLQLFTHVVTHEFHHKGQVLTMSRLLGYVPVDTDVIRT
ncbi:DinB family protein [Hymenobacter sp. DH14]|uniref:DinB family protein n=1 Tax=Hymenobacter cyanobacteriorum TaxID=2926463 RepID=A0A9X1VCT7_9BACT|nr:DinB family protein [Hymenobacter cyanobacteriorum]MCI1186238.1 DinB family protein [Hymenobacter cyanobacteriorum]